MSASKKPETDFDLSDVDSLGAKQAIVPVKSSPHVPRQLPPQTRAKSATRKRKSSSTPSERSLIDLESLFEGLSLRDSVAKANLVLQEVSYFGMNNIYIDIYSYRIFLLHVTIVWGSNLE